MGLKNNEGTAVSPKKYAQTVIYQAAKAAAAGLEASLAASGQEPTDKERALLVEQVAKIIGRVALVTGHGPARVVKAPKTKA